MAAEAEVVVAGQIEQWAARLLGLGCGRCSALPGEGRRLAAGEDGAEEGLGIPGADEAAQAALPLWRQGVETLPQGLAPVDGGSRRGRTLGPGWNSRINGSGRTGQGA